MSWLMRARRVAPRNSALAASAFAALCQDAASAARSASCSVSINCAERRRRSRRPTARSRARRVSCSTGAGPCRAGVAHRTGRCRAATGLGATPMSGVRRRAADVDRLAEVLVESGHQAAQSVTLGDVSGHRDDRKGSATGCLFGRAQASEQFEAVHLRHVEIEQRDVESPCVASSSARSGCVSTVQSCPSRALRCARKRVDRGSSSTTSSRALREGQDASVRAVSAPLRHRKRDNRFSPRAHTARIGGTTYGNHRPPYPAAYGRACCAC